MPWAEAGGTLRIVGASFLEDANTRRLPGYASFDGKVSFQVSSFAMTVEAYNVFDREYATLGFLDPSGETSLSFLYPATGRMFRIGISATVGSF